MPETPDRPPSPSDAERAARRNAERAVLRHVLAANLLAREQVETALGRQAAERARGRSGELFEVLADFLPGGELESLRVLHRREFVGIVSRQGSIETPPPRGSEPATTPERSESESSGGSTPPATKSGEALRPDGSAAPPAPGATPATRTLPTRAVLAAVACIVVAAALVWLGMTIESGRETSRARSPEVAAELRTILDASPGSPLPEFERLLVRVTAIRGRSELPLLRDLLSSESAGVRMNAARLLSRLGDASAGERIAALSEANDALERVVANDSIGRLRGERPLPPLVTALRSPRADLRLYAIDALGEIGSVSALAALRPLTDHFDARTRAAALRAVLSLDPGFAPAPVTLASVRESAGESARESSREAPRTTSARPAPATTERARDEPPRPAPATSGTPPPREETGAGVARRVAPPREEPPEVVAQPPAPKPEPAPAEPKPAKPKPPSPLELARREVTELFEAKRFPETIDAVLKAHASLEQEDAQLLRFAGLAHLELDAPESALEHLRRALDLVPDMAVGYFDMSRCYGALGKIRDAHTALTMALRLGFRDVLAIRAEDRLAKLKVQPAFHELMEHYFHSPLAADPDDTKRLRYASRRLQARMAAEKDPFLRALEVVRFPEPGSLDATRLLFKFMKDRSFIVRRTIAEVLRTTRDEPSIEFLASQATSSRTSDAQLEALMWALDGLPGWQPLEALLAGAEHDSLDVQLAAARGLGNRPQGRSVEPLLRIMERASLLQRLVVAEALGKITGKDLGLDPIDWRNWWEAHGGGIKIAGVRNPCQGTVKSRSVVIPPSFSERTGAARKKALLRYGGSQATELAVDRALEWLARHQSPDGRWDTDEWARRCDERKPWERVTNVRQRIWDTQITGLALMAFLGAGYTHLSGKYHDTVRMGIDFLRKRQRADGYFTGDYHQLHRSHEIATIAVTEAYLMTRDCELRPYVERAVRFILNRQHENGGWGWHRSESYTSLTGWNVMALSTAAEAGIEFPARAFVSLRGFLDTVTIAEKSGSLRPGFAYETLRPAAQVGETLTVDDYQEVRAGGGALSTTVGLWCRVFLGQSMRDSRVSGAMEQLRRPPALDKNGHIAVNEWLFFATQTALLTGGSTWKDWNSGMKEALLGAMVKEQRVRTPKASGLTQEVEEESQCERGSWEPSTDHGRVYSTALGALLLESYYRFHASPTR